MSKKIKKVLVYAIVAVMLVGSTLTAQAAGLRDIFDAKYYAEQYADLAEAFGNDEEALYNHYVTFGFNEGRSMNALIDVKQYREAYADLDAAFGDNWDAYVDHYLTYGFREGRNAYGEFDARYYMETYSDLSAAFGDDVLALYTHYMNHGREEGRAITQPAPVVSNNNGGSQSAPQVTTPVSFSGRITDPSTGAPVAGATVEVTPQGNTPVMQPVIVTPVEDEEEAPAEEVAAFAAAGIDAVDEEVADEEVADEEVAEEEEESAGVVVINPYVTTTDANGFYSFNIYPGSYSLVASADDYLVLTMDTVIVNDGEASVAPTITLISENETGASAIAGCLTNALNGEPIEGVKVELRARWNNYNGAVAYTTYTDANGTYNVEANVGYYTATYSKDGFVTKSQNTIAIENATSNIQNEALTPVMEEETSYRVVLTWGETPRDLDSHITGPTEDGDGYFHVCYWNEYYRDAEGNDIVTLDHDDVTSYGPETVTLITPQDDAIYRYSVHNYSGEADMKISNATVVVYEGTTLVATYHIPLIGEGDVWNVFDIVDGEIIAVNQFKTQGSSNGEAYYAEEMFVD